jgi:uncharacterized membrane protein (DUF4010 family)
MAVHADLAPFVGLGIALGTGLLIGLERGWAQRARAEGERLAGLRTFALIGLFGGLSGLLMNQAGPGVVVAGVLVVAAAMLLGYRQTVRLHGDLSLTSAIAALVTFLVGVLSTQGQEVIAAAAAVVMAALLQLKQTLHAGVARLSELELRSGIQLLLISVVVLPVLPDRGFGPWQALNPYQLWWSVVLLALLSFAGFVLMRWVGTHRGVTATALLGGMVSSTATTATLARWAKEAPALRSLAAAGVVLACAAMFARMAVLVSVVAPGLGATAIGALVAMAATGGAIGFVQARGARADGTPEMNIGNPLRIGLALQFAAFLAGVLLAGRFLAERFGDTGLIASAAVAGLLDVDAITLSVGRMASEGVVAARSATWAIFVAATVNQLTKLGLAATLAGPALALRLALPFAAMAGAGALTAGLLR